MSEHTARRGQPTKLARVLHQQQREAMEAAWRRVRGDLEAKARAPIRAHTLEEWKRLRDEIDRLDPGNPLISRINVFVTALEAEPCRCGHLGDSPEPHPCHGVAYTCRKPAMERFYAPRLVCLAGVQPKVGARSTWACEECWEEFQEQLRDQQR